MFFSRWKLFNRYFCDNCGKWFRTGCYSKVEEQDPECKGLYDDICPRCGALVGYWFGCFRYFFTRKGKSAHRKRLEKLADKHRRDNGK